MSLRGSSNFFFLLSTELHGTNKENIILKKMGNCEEQLLEKNPVG